MTHTEKTIAALKEKFGDAVEHIVEFRGQTTAIIKKESIVDALRFLKTSPDLHYTFLAELTAFDDWPEEPRFKVIYEVREMSRPANFRLKCEVHGENPVIDSVTDVFLNANWHERELFDMFGIKFNNHPDLRRLLMPADWQGHPLRKDYPLGYEEVQFTFNFDEIDKKKPYAKE